MLSSPDWLNANGLSRALRLPLPYPSNIEDACMPAAPQSPETSSSKTLDAEYREPLRIVAIGASAGGLEALETFFDHMPPNAGLAYVVIQHLSPDFLSMMDEILARHTSLAIHQAVDGMAVQANAIYLLPPKMLMLIVNGRLLLTERDPAQGLTLPIDIFFRALAQDVGTKAVAIVLSGSGSDGSRGIRDVHEAGGLVLAQSPASAKFDSMPVSAIATGVVDFVVPPEDMPGALLQQLADAANRFEDVTPLADDDLKKIFTLLQESHGIDFCYYKQATVGRRIQRRMMLRGYDSLANYTRDLANDTAELNALYKDLLIGVTQFFRNPEAFSTLERVVVPAILTGAAPAAGLRIWVAGCATGEEVYSVAMILREQALRMEHPIKVKIFATDVHRESLEFASAGFYSEASLENVSRARRERYFVRHGDQYQVLPELRQMVVFSQHDLVKTPPFTKLDLITCRNLLIYFQPQLQKKVLSMFHFALRTKGVLFLGPSETVGELENEFDAIDRTGKIYGKRRDVRLMPAGRLSEGLPLSTRHLIAPPAATTARSDQRLLKIYDALIEKHLPPGFLVNERRELIHTFGDAGKLLRIQGRTSADILDLVSGDLRIALATAIQRAFKSKSTVIYKKIRMLRPEGEQLVSLTVDPLEDKMSKSIYLHITLQTENISKETAGGASVIHIEEASRDHIRNIEEELSFTKESLQASVEELETSNEELQAANEELVASNEELQSTNEELHSVNEELYTVNYEYENKISELLQLTRDIDNLLKSTDIGTIFLDKSLNIRKYTPTATTIFNVLPQDLGRPIQHISSNLVDDEELLDKARLVLETGVPTHKEVRNQQGVWFLKRILPYRTEGNAIDGVLVTFVDISRIKETENALRQSEEKFRFIFEQAGIGIVLLNAAGDLLEANQSLTNILGYSAEELALRTFGKILHPDDVAAGSENYRKIVSGETAAFCMDARCERSDGVHIWTRLTFTRITAVTETRPFVAIGMIADITERKRMEIDILAAKEMAEAASCAKTEFLANMSHEIRTPISGIMGISDLLLTSPLSEEIRQYVTMIQASAASLLGIINDILDMSKIEARMLELSPVDFGLRDMLDTVLNNFSVQARERGLAISLDCAADVPDRLRGDWHRLAQIINNLLSNALKFTDRGRVQLVVVKRELSDAAVTLQFSVSDTGIGIPEERRYRLFQYFSQGDSSFSKQYGGTGLGLAISKKLAELLGGTIWFESTPEQGTTFFFTAVFTFAQGPSLPRIDQSRAKEVSEDMRPLRILLAEDNQINRIYVSKLLRNVGHEIDLAADGQEALEALVRKPYDLILMDVQMPVMDGVAATRRIRASEDPFVRNIPIIALTAYAMDGDRERLIKEGMDDYLSKPVDKERLIQVIAQVAATSRLTQD